MGNGVSSELTSQGAADEFLKMKHHVRIEEGLVMEWT